jgi:7,8-dihydropterin-6-yl-methyl-4-(beta-D-ribofuranosyl)aminobenzene 5'-phosphate synthase
MKRRQWMATALSAPAMLSSGCSSLGQATAGADTARPRITVLFDALCSETHLIKDWGYAALIEIGGRRILFDTGNNGETLAHNARALGADLGRLDMVVMSHRHGDHMGGMAHLLSVNPKVTIYAPKEGFGVYGGDLPGSFYRRSEGLPAHRRYYDGKPPEVMRFGAAWPGANIRLIDKTTELAPGVHAISLVSDKPGTLELRELSLALSTPQGLVLVVGCSHPGIDRILEAAVKIDPRIHLIAGGMHMVVSKDDEIAKTIGVMQNTYKVAYVAPGHCTGEPAFEAMGRAFGDRYLYAGVGARLMLGAKPQALVSDGSRPVLQAGLNGDDLKSYREMAAANDQKRRGLFAHLRSSNSPDVPDGAYLGQLQRSMVACC